MHLSPTSKLGYLSFKKYFQVKLYELIPKNPDNSAPYVTGFKFCDYKILCTI